MFPLSFCRYQNALLVRMVLGLQAWLWAIAGAVPALAAPVLSVSDGGMSNGNQLWMVEIAPDADLFAGVGGSLAAELAFEVEGTTLVGALVNSADWPHDLPGNDPFTGGISEGLVVDEAFGSVFAAFGSQYLTTADPVAILTIETLGADPATLHWGGHQYFAGTPDAYTGSRVAQNGTAFTSYMGSLTLGGSTEVDIDEDGDVDGSDFLQIQRKEPSLIAAWESEFGTGGNAGTQTVSIPEPASLLLLAVGLASLAYARQRRTTNCPQSAPSPL